MVLAAGYGTRMLPLSNECTKAMMPFWGRPLIVRVLDMLEEWGAREVIINCHHRANDLTDYFSHHYRGGLRVTLSWEPDILGTGGGIRNARWFFDNSPFWVINADIVASVRPESFVRSYQRHRPIAVLWMNRNKGPCTVRMRGASVVDFRSGTPGDPGSFTFCGLQLLDSRVFDYIPEGDCYSIVSAYERAMRSGELIAGVVPRTGFWADTGTPEDYLNAHADYFNFAGNRDPDTARLAKKVKGHSGIRGFAALMDGVRMEAGATVKNSVIWSGCTIGKGARLEDAIIGRGAKINGAACNIITRADSALQKWELKITGEMGWKNDRAIVQSFSARGSSRQYLRLIEGQNHVMIMRYDSTREENTLFTLHAGFLKSLGIRIPEIIHENSERGFVIHEDLGDTSLLDIAKSGDWDKAMPCYRQVLRQISVLHGKGSSEARRRRLKMMPSFGPDIYKWERELFSFYYLKGILALKDSVVRDIESELMHAESALRREPDVLIHRDLQSSNVMVWRGQAHIIDFQGMRYGPAVYDLASLLFDPYVCMPDEFREECLLYYKGHAADDIIFSGDALWWAAVQRLAQAIGAYGRLSGIPGCLRFRDHIPPSLRMLKRVLHRVDSMPLLQESVNSGLRRLL